MTLSAPLSGYFALLALTLLFVIDLSFIITAFLFFIK